MALSQQTTALIRWVCQTQTALAVSLTPSGSHTGGGHWLPDQHSHLHAAVRASTATCANAMHAVMTDNNLSHLPQ
jgi:hypothetical protein